MPRQKNQLSTSGPPPSTTDLEQQLTKTQISLAEAQAFSSRLSTLNEAVVAMQKSLDPDVVLHTLVSQARWVLDFQYCSIALRDGMVYRLQLLRRGKEVIHDTRLYPIASDPVSRTLQQGQVLVLSTTSETEGGPPGMQSALILPLCSQGSVIGTLNFYARASHHYQLADLQVASALAVHVATILQNVHLFNSVTRAHNELHTVLESIHDAVLVIDQAGRIVLLNQSLRDMLNLPEGDVIGRRALWLLRAPSVKDTLGKMRNELRPLIAQWRQFPTPSASTSKTLQLTDGRNIELIYAPLTATHTPAGFVLTLRDVSARINLEQLRQDMVHMLVHDLRTPLTALIMGLELLDPSNGTDVDGSALTLEYTRQAAQDMFNQVDMILDVSKLEAGRMDLDQNIADIQMLIKQATMTLQPIIQRDRQQLVLELNTNLPPVAIDTRLIRRVIENLVGNALKFTPPGGSIDLRTFYNEDTNALEVEVEDSGLGVPPAMRERIFEKYVQVRQGRGRTGTGLGLNFCKLVVEAHGGQIGVRDAPQQGSIFWFTIPLTAMPYQEKQVAFGPLASEAA